jgi:hypothetical protein
LQAVCYSKKIQKLPTTATKRMSLNVLKKT